MSSSILSFARSGVSSLRSSSLFYAKRYNFALKSHRLYGNDCFVMPKTALLILPDGSEEMEAVVTIDVLRRAGVKVVVAGFDGTQNVTCSRDVVVVPDTSFIIEKDKKWDCVVLPGGLGASKAFCGSSFVKEILQRQEETGCYIAAICAAPTALAYHNICLGKSLTSYPSVKPQLEAKYKYVENQKVVQDGNLITSRGPGTAIEFALKISEALVGPEKTQEVAKGMIYG